jgi:hypothetical protein
MIDFCNLVQIRLFRSQFWKETNGTGTRTWSEFGKAITTDGMAMRYLHEAV